MVQRLTCHTVNVENEGSIPSGPATIWRDGRVWFMALVLKTSMGKLILGSNPSLSAKTTDIVQWIEQGPSKS